ncbi:MAG: hypothetical protein EA397_18765 [Deltaproteobacteria bacterium]|nr:MAG: hypothetical protein EA397_18765 [Deltaproteobacteria bacterium]
MKQVLQSYRTGELWLADLSPPQLKERGARVRTVASLISAGTERSMIALAQKSLIGKARSRPDLVRRVIKKMRQDGVRKTVEQVQSKLNEPVPLGYSCAGVVVDALQADHLRPGMRVVCAGAGYANHSEMNWVPRNLIAPLPDTVSFEHGATATVGAIALQGVRHAAPRLGDRIVVIGLGLIGNLAAQLARASGARVFGIDLDPSKVELGRRTGCVGGTSEMDRAVEAVMAFTQGHGADAVILAAGAPEDSRPTQLAVELVRQRGKVVILGVVGMNIPRNEAYRKELDVHVSMSYGPGRYDSAYEERGEDYPFAFVRYTEQRNLVAYLDAVADGRLVLDPLLTHRFPIDEALDAYGLIQSGREPHLGILLRYAATDDPELGVPAVPRPAMPAATPARAPIEALRGPIGIGLLGAGSYVRGVLLPALAKQDVERIGVVNRSGPSAEQSREAGGFRWSGTEVDRVLSDPSIHAVVIGTPHHLHAEQVIACLDAGKHVFVEKPLCLSHVELQAIAAALERSGRFLQVGTNRRHSPYASALREQFSPRADPLVISVRVNAGRLPAGHWLRDPQVGGGRLLGEGVHWVDLCAALVGRPVRSVVATPSPGGATSLAGDTWAAQLSFVDGSLATITYAADGPTSLEKERIEVVGLGCAAEVLNWSSGRVYTTAGRRPLRVGRGQLKGTDEQLTAFFRTLRGEPPAVDLDETLHVQHATLLLVDTLRDGVPAQATWPYPEAG